MSTGANTFITTHPASWISPFGFQSFLLFYHETIWMRWFIGLPMLCSEETDRVCSHPALWLDSLISRQDKDGLCLNEPMWWSERCSSIHLSFNQTWWLGWKGLLLKIQIIEKQCWRSINCLRFTRNLPLWLLHSKSCCHTHFSCFLKTAGKPVNETELSSKFKTIDRWHEIYCMTVGRVSVFALTERIFEPQIYISPRSAVTL